MQKLSRDGVALAYEERGQGGPPMLFVHGWSCNHTHFQAQVEQFSRAHRTIAVDLRGFGESDSPHQEYTMAGFADDLAWLCEQLGVERPVVVGHSMGAVVALELAASHPFLPSAIVMLDGGTRTIVPTPGDRSIELAQVMRHAPDLEAVRDTIGGMFLPTSDPELRAWITERMLSTPRHVMASAWEQLRMVDGASAARACSVPVLYINAATWRPELERFRELCPQLIVGQTVGAGHFNMIEAPEQVNGMIERFLVLSAVASPTPATGRAVGL
jgi:pimeloyl-ACP methyl ester carboxylesterase